VTVGWLSQSAEAELRALIRDEVAVALAAREREAQQQRWLSSTEAARYVGTTPRGLYSRVRRGRIPPNAVRHVGRRLLFDRRSLDRQLEESP
jgi:Helix-turn-helix domain